MIPHLAPLILVLAAPSATPPTPPLQDPGSRVDVELLAGASRLTPGASLTLGIRLKMQPGWHVYWENAGDSGLATRVNLEVPEGFSAGPILFPGPERFDLPGDIVNYGYEGEVLFFAEVTVPEDVDPAATYSFRTAADWLVCREVCFPGNGKAMLELGVTTKEDPATPNNEELFGKHRPHLPQPWSRLDGVALRASQPGDDLAFALSVEGAEDLEFFPFRNDSMSIRSTTMTTREGRCNYSARLDFEPDDEHHAPAVRGLLRVRRDGRAAYYVFEQVWPQSNEGE